MATNASMFTSMEDRALLNAAKHLVIEKHLATAALLRALMEIDTRRLYLREGCASMFSYCTQVLHLAEGAAYNRIEAARAARSYPLDEVGGSFSKRIADDPLVINFSVRSRRTVGRKHCP